MPKITLDTEVLQTMLVVLSQCQQAIEVPESRPMRAGALASIKLATDQIEEAMNR